MRSSLEVSFMIGASTVQIWAFKLFLRNLKLDFSTFSGHFPYKRDFRPKLSLRISKKKYFCMRSFPEVLSFQDATFHQIWPAKLVLRGF